MSRAALPVAGHLPRFLVIESGPRELEELLAPFVSVGCAVERAGSIEDALATLQGTPELVLLELAAGVEGLAELRARIGAGHVMVVGPRSDAELAARALALGAHEWLMSDLLDEEARFDAIERCLLLGPRPALPARRRKQPGLSQLLGTPGSSPAPLGTPGSSLALGSPGSSPAPGSPRSSVAGDDEDAGLERGEPSATLERGVPRMPAIRRVLEVGEDGGPARRPLPGIEYAGGDLERLDLVLHCPERFAARTILLGFARDELTVWASYEVLRTYDLGASRHAVEAQRARGPRDFFAAQQCLPTFDASEMRYRRPLLGEAARAWAELGILREVELDRVLVCPRCQALPTFRLGCPRCGSACVDGQKLIHHFPCAHVGPVRDYQLDGLLVCPKCGERPLVVNADFEYLSGPLVCADCGHSDAEGELIGHCFACGQRFLARIAATFELRGYDADRLDPLDLGLPA